MKRYTAEELRSDLYYTLPDDSVFYSRADLIAAGCLVPVPVGEAKHPEEGDYNVLYDTGGGVLAIHYASDEMFFLSDNPGFVKLPKYASMTPVRLVPIAEAVK